MPIAGPGPFAVRATDERHAPTQAGAAPKTGSEGPLYVARWHGVC